MFHNISHGCLGNLATPCPHDHVTDDQSLANPHGGSCLTVAKHPTICPLVHNTQW